MKHILAALLAIACILTLCACGASETQSTNSKNSVRTDESKTSFSEGVGSNSLPVQKTQAKDLELTDYGFCAGTSYDDIIYMDFCGMVYNPNESLAAMFPEVIATVSNPDGTILATDSQMGMEVLPLDTVTITGIIAVPTSQITEETTIQFQVKCSNFSSADLEQKPKTSDFEVKNISEQSGSQCFITGTVTNLTDNMVDMVNLSLLLRKDGKIVFIENEFVDDIQPGAPTAFQFRSFSPWPDHDAVEVTAQAW